MRMYIIGVMVGVMGLVAANQVRADEHCGLKSPSVIDVASWNVEQGKPGIYELAVFLDSKDPKTIGNVGGLIEFFAGKDRVFTVPLEFAYRLQFNSEFRQKVSRKKLPAPIMVKAPDVEAFAWVAAIGYDDGTGVVIN